jgi:hypothetical protein
VTTAGADRFVLLHFDGLAQGAYRLVIDAAHVTDRLGRALGTAADVTHFTVVQPTSISWVGLGTPGAWGDPKNWSTGKLPGPSDSVTMTLRDDEVVRYSTGITNVRSLQVTGGLLEVDLGALTVSEPSQIDRLRIAHPLFFGSSVFDGSGSLTIARALVRDGGTLIGTGDTFLSRPSRISTRATGSASTACSTRRR